MQVSIPHACCSTKTGANSEEEATSHEEAEDRAGHRGCVFKKVESLEQDPAPGGTRSCAPACRSGYCRERRRSGRLRSQSKDRAGVREAFQEPEKCRPVIAGRRWREFGPR